MVPSHIRKQIASASTELDKLASRIVGVMCNATDEASLPWIEFSPVSGDPQSFDARVHRITIRFELNHAIKPEMQIGNGPTLVGQYAACIVDRKGDLINLSIAAIVFPTGDILFADKSHHRIPEQFTVFEKNNLRTAFSDLALDLAQSKLPLFSGV